MNRNRGIDVAWIGLIILVSVIVSALFTEPIRAAAVRGNQKDWATVIGFLAVVVFIPIVVVGKLFKRDIASAGIRIWLSVILAAIFAEPIKELFGKDWPNFFFAIFTLLIFIFLPLIAFNRVLTVGREEPSSNL